MVPENNDGLRLGFRFEEQPTGTWELHVEKHRATGRTDGLDAMAQAIYLVLGVERYECPIYSWNYGVELAGLLGKPIPWCVPEIKRRVTEALLQDSRILSVGDFIFETGRKSITARFTAKTIFGDVEGAKEVAV